MVSETTEVSAVTAKAKPWVEAWNNGTMDIETILTKMGNSKTSEVTKNEVMRIIQEQGGVAWRKPNDPMVKKIESIQANITDLLSNQEQLQNVSG